MKRPQKVTRETRLNQYARKMYGKEKTEKLMENDHGRGKNKKIKTMMNRKLRHSMKNKELPDGGAYKKETDWEE